MLVIVLNTYGVKVVHYCCKHGCAVTVVWFFF